MCIDTRVGSERVMPCGNLNHFYGAFLLGFLWQIILLCMVLVCIRYILGTSHVCTCISQPRWILLKRHLGGTSVDMTPLWPPSGPFCTYVVQEVSQLLKMRTMWSVQGPASSLNCPAILVLEFQAIGNESPIALLWGRRVGWGCWGHLLPASIRMPNYLSEVQTAIQPKEVYSNIGFVTRKADKAQGSQAKPGKVININMGQILIRAAATEQNAFLSGESGVS